VSRARSRGLARGLLVYVIIPCLPCAALALGACRPQDDVITGPFIDDFDRAELGPSWRDTGGDYKIVDGKLIAKNAYNHPAWLRKRLPADVAIEFDARSSSPAGDIKIELFGDGESFDPDRGGYVSTGYVLIFGGWHNSLSVICRNNEHDDGRKAARSDRRVELGRTYHMGVTRKGGTLDWRIDGAPFLSWTDPQPLGGRGHDYLAVDDWEAEVAFDNLQIRPAP
jgi:hypothetical protein